MLDALNVIPLIRLQKRIVIIAITARPIFVGLVTKQVINAFAIIRRILLKRMRYRRMMNLLMRRMEEIREDCSYRWRLLLQEMILIKGRRDLNLRNKDWIIYSLKTKRRKKRSLKRDFSLE